MALSNRHRWCIDKIAAAFATQIDDEAMKVKVQGFIRAPANLEKFNQFFKGDGPQKLFVFYQTPEVPGADVDDWSPDKGTPDIFISSGSSSEDAIQDGTLSGVTSTLSSMVDVISSLLRLQML